jgi:PTH1 family peptidyl-tRNA hydrolase
MNRSGWAVECLVDAHQVPIERVLVAFDDVALPLGALRLRPRGGPGGHRGLESVIACLRTDEVPRLRLGIAPPADAEPPADLSDFVLAPFAETEREPVDQMLARAVEAVETWRDSGLEAAMNRFNG